VRTSISITNYSCPGGAPELAAHLREVAQTADESGIDTVWVADHHLLQADPAASPEDPMLEAFSTLGYLAAASSRVRLGTMVTPVTFRAPALLLKAVTTLDVLSGGRAWLGLGAGYGGEEHRSMGLPLPPVAERFEKLEDTLRLAHQMRRGDAAPFHGIRTTLERPLMRPEPLTSNLPIMVGGTGERRTLRLVAQYADACNLFDIPDGGATVRHKLEVLRQHLRDVGRPAEQVEVTISTAVAPGESAASFWDRCAAIAELGIDHVVVITRGRPWDRDTVETVAAAHDVTAT